MSVSEVCARNIVMIQEHLKQLYGPEHYYTKEYHKHELNYVGRLPIDLTEQLMCMGFSSFVEGRHPDPQVLDIGPGYGLLSCLASQYGGKVTMLDRIAYISPKVQETYSLYYALMDPERQPIPTPTYGYDAIILTEVLEHFNFHPVSTLMKIRDVLAPKGRLYLSTPDSDTWGRLNKYKSLDSIPVFPQKGQFNTPPWIDGHIWQYNEQELLDVVTTAGFQVIENTRSRSAGGDHFNLILTSQM